MHLSDIGHTPVENTLSGFGINWAQACRLQLLLKTLSDIFDAAQSASN